MSDDREAAGGWNKSSWTDVNCVEVRFDVNRVHVRDSKDRHGPVLTFTHAEWRAFLAGVLDGEFNIPAKYLPSPR